MEQIKNILIAVELDKDSEVILEYGITLGVMLDASVKCLHITRPLSSRILYDNEGIAVENYSEYILDDTESVDEMVEDDLAKLHIMVSNVLQKLEIKDHPISVNVVPDFAIPGILDQAEKSNSDLIIVGAHVDYRKKDNAVSNLAKKIIDDSTQSVIVVPTSYGNRNLDHICMFINFEFDELDMIKDMIDVIRWNGLHLTFVHMLRENEEVIEADSKLEVFRRIFLDSEEDPLISFKLVAGKLSHVIDDLSNDMDVDLIGLKLKKKAWKLFNMETSFEDKIMDHIKVPLFVWKN